jgi:sec-independent protein translocase protein TatB
VFNVGGGEIVVILVIALFVLGPTRLPGAARQVGRAIAEFRRVTSNVETDLRGALDSEGLRESMATIKQVTNLGQTVRSEFASAASSIISPVSNLSNGATKSGSSGSSSASSSSASSSSASFESDGTHGGGVAIAPPDGLYLDDLPAASTSGAQVPSPTPNGAAFFDVLGHRGAPAPETASLGTLAPTPEDTEVQ